MNGEAAIPEPASPDLDFTAFQRIYGPIKALSPAEAAVLFDGAPFRWWIAGGWSVELEPEPRRFHEDLEVAVPHTNVATLREWLRDYHLWDTHDGMLRFLTPDVEIAIGHEQLWLRRDAFSPWLLDLMLTTVVDGIWTYKRDGRITRPLEAIVRIGTDTIPYQRPEITLLFKARRRWKKDEEDFAAVVPRLEPSDRAWLRDAIALTEPTRHPWVERLG
jgi:hypothetical protein